MNGATKKGRSRDVITASRRDQVVALIDRWKPDWGKLSGDRLAVKVGADLGFQSTRQGLLKHEPILNAFDAKRMELNGDNPPPKPKLAEEELYQQRVERLQARIETLESENKRLKQQFVLWQANTRRKGLTIADLEAPLPSPRPEITKVGPK